MGIDLSDELIVNSKSDDLIRCRGGLWFTTSCPKNGRLIIINDDGPYCKLQTGNSMPTTRKIRD